jgi:acyl-coenzyme A thioesterase PaaI-like protein
MERWTFGEAPLPAVVELAAVVRDLTSTVLSLERTSPELEELTGMLRDAQARIARAVPADPAPRVGANPTDDQRVYVDHSRDIGDYNPCFPRYEFAVDVDGTGGRGTVEFPVCYEGPPGIVHGGFLAVFFDCVLQQLNCDLGQAGKTAELSLRFRRPTPLLTPLVVHAERTIDGGRIHSRAHLERDGTVVCEAEMRAALGDRAALPVVSPRRP